VPAAFTAVSKGVQWYSSEVGPGDVVLFNIKTVHAATKNTSVKFRLRYCMHLYHEDIVDHYVLSTN